MPRGERKQTWSADKRDRFARDWNAGMDADVLREKYGVRQPAHAAATLRGAGYALRRRRGGNRPDVFAGKGA